MMTVGIGDIIVPKSFGTPRESKMNTVREHMEKYGTLDKPVVLQGDLLVDGYVRYLVAKEYGMKRVPCVQTSELNTVDDNKPNTYIIGRFKSSNKEYVWKLPNKISVEVGDCVLVDSRFAKKNRAVVTVVRVFHSDDKDMLHHKSVIKKLHTNKNNCGGYYNVK